MESTVLQLSTVSLMLCGVSLVIAGAVLIRSNGRLSDFLIVMGLLQLPAGTLIGTTLMGLAAVRPGRFDLYVNRFDGLFGYPSNYTAVLLARYHLLRTVSVIDYHFYWVPLFIGLLFLAKIDVDQAWRGLLSCSLAGLTSIPLFMIFPVCGPLYALPNFPVVYTGPVHTQLIHSIPNCVPSVHFTMALFSLWFLRKSRTGIALGSIHTALTALATLGLGLHYIFDLFVAVPYAAAVLTLPSFAKQLYSRKETKRLPKLETV